MKALFFAVVSAIVAVLPLVIRRYLGQPLFPGTDAYLAVGFIEALGFARGISALILIIISVLLLSSSVFMAYNTLKRFKIKQSKVDPTISLIILSPAFLSGAALFPSHALYIFLLASGFFLIRRRSILGKAGIVLLSIAAIGMFWEIVSNEISFSVTRSIVDLGASGGYGLFALIAAIVGASVLWKNKAKNYFITLGMILLVLASFAIPILIVPGSLTVSVVGGLGFARLLSRRWTFQLVRMLSIILFICGILFSTVTFATFEIRSQPNIELVTALSELKFQLPQGLIATDPTNTIWLEYWASREISNASASELEVLWYSRNLENSTRILIENDIEIILITPEMRREIWTGDEEGLLFILQNSKAFEQYRSDLVQAWVFDPTLLNLSDT